MEMPKFKVPVVWKVWGVMEIEADTLEDAVDEAIGDHSLPTDGDYIDESIVVDRESDLFGEIIEE
jgi:hypothetical protein